MALQCPFILFTISPPDCKNLLGFMHKIKLFIFYKKYLVLQIRLNMLLRYLLMWTGLTYQGLSCSLRYNTCRWKCAANAKE